MALSAENDGHLLFWESYDINLVEANLYIFGKSGIDWLVENTDFVGIGVDTLRSQKKEK